MADITNEALDKLVTKLGDYVEKNYKEVTNKKHSVLRSAISVTFNALVSGTKLLHDTAAAYGIKVDGWHNTLDQIVAATEARGSNAADKIKTIVIETKKLDVICDRLKVKKGWDKIEMIKKL